jgi:hypothetical protein
VTFTRIGTDYNQWIEREAAQADMDKRIQEYERMAEPQEILAQIGWDVPGKVFFSLNLTPEQWNVFQDAAQVAGELTAEEMITEALQEWITRRTEGKP